LNSLAQVAQFLGIVIIIMWLIIDIYWYNYWSRNYEGRLLTDGPYKYVRHPFYTGFLLLAVGLAMAFPIFETRLLLVMTLAVLVVFIPREEEELERRYKKQYEEYKKDVPCRLIPRLY
jgi:protein-S-isoprenylcysteine O-methyltransferase Ste14